MKLPLFAIYGASGFGREVMPLAREQLRIRGIFDDQLIFIDDGATSSMINGHRVMSYEAFLKSDTNERHVALAIANNAVRERLANQCQNDGLRFWSISASNVVILDKVRIDEGAILTPFVTLTSTIYIGRHFHANLYSYVGHDCRIGNFVTFAPGVKCNGNVVIEDHAYIGTGAILRQGTPSRPLIIGHGAVVGMGAVVTKDVPPMTTVVGNPARPLIKEPNIC